MSLRYSSLCATACGRGPTTLIFPSSTLNSCGSSSSEVRRRKRPKRVIRGSSRRGLRHHRAVLANRHATELVDSDFLAVQAVAALAEQNRSRGGHLHADGDDSHERRENNYQRHLASTTSNARLRTASIPWNGVSHTEQRRHSVDVDQPSLDQVEGEHIRQEVDRGGGVAQLTDHLPDARHVAERQRDVDGRDAVGADEIGDVLAVADQLVAAVGPLRDAIGAAESRKSPGIRAAAAAAAARRPRCSRR